MELPTATNIETGCPYLPPVIIEQNTEQTAILLWLALLACVWLVYSIYRHPSQKRRK